MNKSKLSPLRLNITICIVCLIVFISIIPLIINFVLFYFHQSTIDYFTFLYSVFPSILLTDNLTREWFISYPLIHVFLNLSLLVVNLVLWITIYSIFYRLFKRHLFSIMAYFTVLFIVMLIFNHFSSL